MSSEQKHKDKDLDADIQIDENGKEPKEPKEKNPEGTLKKTNDSKFHRFINWYKSSKKKSIPLTVLVLLALLAAVPWCRYQIAGLALKKNFELKIVDSATGTPVSGADVNAGSIHAASDGSGKAVLHQVKVGTRTVLITKKYYKDARTTLLVPIFKQKSQPTVQFAATGRQVKISVKNLVSRVALADVNIKIADVSAKTDKSGSAIVVIPAGTKSEKASLSLNGYNNVDVTVNTSDQTIQENDFNLTPAGTIYFLSKLSGKIDVVKTNLDGTNRQTVLAGTGKEDNYGTMLLASRDWKYLALLSNRDGTNINLYLIDTKNDGLSTIYSGAKPSINLIGWSNDNFIYSVTRQDVPVWQPAHQILNSFNAIKRQNVLLDQTAIDNSGNIDGYNNPNVFARESFGNIYLISPNIVYEKYTNNAWRFDPTRDIDTTQAIIYSISDGGKNLQNLKTIAYDNSGDKKSSLVSLPYEANQLYYKITDKDEVSYYSYANGHFSSRNDIADTFNSYQPKNYLQSPSGDETFWSEPRDGKNTFLLGDQSGNNGKQVAAFTDFQPFGWYTDDYLLVSKKGSELYIMPKNPAKDIQPQKITDYQSSGSYGGL